MGRPAYQRNTRCWEYVVFNDDNDIEEEALEACLTSNESSVLELNRLSKSEWKRQSGTDICMCELPRLIVH